MEAHRIVIVNHVAQLGGAERVLMNLLEHLDRDRYKADLVFLEDGPLADQADRLGYRVRVHPSGRLRHPLHYVRTVSAIRSAVREARAQLVVSWAPKPHMYGGPAALLERVPAIWWQHGVPAGSWFDRAVSRIPARSVVCPSAVVSTAQERLNPKYRVVVQHPGILPDRFRFDPDVRADVRRQLGIPDAAVVFAYVGRLQRWKRADVAIRAFAEALKGKNAYLLVVGGALFGVETEVEAELIRLAAQAGLARQVVFTGHQSRVEPYLWASDAVVHTSLLEPFGMVIVEAMASGRLVMAVNRGGPTEIIRDGQDGLLYDGSARQLAELMRQVAERPDDYAHLGAEAARAARERFSAGRMAERFQGLMAAAIAR